MSIILEPDVESRIERKVASGRYTSADDVVRESLELLDEQDLLRQLRSERVCNSVMVGVNEIDSGQFITLETDEDQLRLAAILKANGRKLLEERRKLQRNGSS